MEKREAGPDRWLLLTAVSLVFLGVFVVFDASYARAGQSTGTGNNPFFYLNRQALWAALSLGALWLGMCFPYQHYRRVAHWGLGLSLFLLVAVLFVGISVNGSKRWLGFGLLRFQPSELAKIAVVIALAAYSDAFRTRIRELKGFVLPVGVLLVVGALVAKEDLGTAISLVLTGLIVLYLGGARPAHMGALLAGAVAVGVGFVMIEPYRLDRVRAWLDPWGHYNGPGYQPVHGLLALGSGGFFGKGIALGTQKFLYLPAEHTDYIFATIGEEFGLIGSAALLAAFFLLVVRGLTVAHRTQDWFGSLLAAGLTAMLGVQAVLNVAVVTSSIPATGVPLPFISYGGSSLVFTTLAAGIILNVSQNACARAPLGQPVEEEEWGVEGRRHRWRNRWAHLSGT
jgi:cell division protein FtsW